MTKWSFCFIAPIGYIIKSATYSTMLNILLCQLYFSLCQLYCLLRKLYCLLCQLYFFPCLPYNSLQSICHIFYYVCNI